MKRTGTRKDPKTSNSETDGSSHTKDRNEQRVRLIYRKGRQDRNPSFMENNRDVENKEQEKEKN